MSDCSIQMTWHKKVDNVKTKYDLKIRAKSSLIELSYDNWDSITFNELYVMFVYAKCCLLHILEQPVKPGTKRLPNKMVKEGLTTVD